VLCRAGASCGIVLGCGKASGGMFSGFGEASCCIVLGCGKASGGVLHVG
jgi:hypothetical protein